MKARVNSWTKEFQDEDGTSIDAYLSITMPDPAGEDIDFETAFATKEEADQWCRQLEALIDGCTVTASDWREQYDRDAAHREEKENVCFSQGTHIEALEAILRDAYIHLPLHLQERVDQLFKSN